MTMAATSQTAANARIVEDAVQLACRAPSYHNSQPWRWVITPDGVQLFVDTDRLVATDTSGRQAVISCGAALDHFRVAAAAAGFRTTVHRYPDSGDHLHLATITLAPADTVTAFQRRQADAILARRTDRLPLAAPADPATYDLLLGAAHDADAAAVDVIDPADRPTVADAAQLTEALRLYDSAYHHEIGWWTSPFEVTDGIPHSSLVSAAEADRVDVGRNFPVTQHAERRRHIAEDQAGLLVISAPEDTRLDMLRCGERLSALLLDATMAGLSSCTLSHLTEVPATRDIVGGLVNRAHPQIVVRIGLASELDDVPPPTPRRPLGEVLHVRI
ncbi:Acg family FMN-binding oxidoreductase [Mycolicibacterium neoaurum]|uniref:Acg family FMN-binding oxidoreductase n=2 Tax=Mycobacteriaceae TaxID=1762 RepID=UPI0003828BA3